MQSKVDIWAVGVVLYTLFSGRPPFEGHDIKQVLAEVKKGEAKFGTKVWTVATGAKDFVAESGRRPSGAAS